MRTLVHISDLHFGRIDEALIAPLTSLIQNVRPDVVVVSGDLTQRARTGQFMAARRFLDALPMPQIIVPGNHDIPLYNLFGRFAQPLKKYRLLITNDLEPFYVDDEIAVIGVNTARSLTIKNGRVNEAQLGRVRERLCALGDHIAKIVVTHHPFDLPARLGGHELVGRAPLAMKLFASCRIDMLLAGHLHASHAGNTTERYRFGDYSAIAVQAGTATSTRGRGESNSFNVIRVGAGRIVVEHMSWQSDREAFVCVTTEVFTPAPGGWARSGGP